MPSTSKDRQVYSRIGGAYNNAEKIRSSNGHIAHKKIDTVIVSMTHHLASPASKNRSNKVYSSTNKTTLNSQKQHRGGAGGKSIAS